MEGKGGLKEKEKDARYYSDETTLNNEVGDNPCTITDLQILNVLPENYQKWITEKKEIELAKRIPRQLQKLKKFTKQQAETKALELAGLKQPEEIFKPQGQVKFYIEEQPIYYDKNCLWWVWNRNEFKWERSDEVDILNNIEAITGEDIITPKNRTLILNSLKQECRKTKPKEMELTWIQFRDKVYDIETNEIWKASPDYFITNPIPFELGKTEDIPQLDKLFEQWVGKESFKELYEFMAFCLVPSYFIHRIFCLIGSGANGKSTYLKVLNRFLGRENLTSSSLYLLMSQRFEGSKLLKKLCCVMGEVNFNMINNTDFLKKLTGEDMVRAEFKGKDGFDFINYAKLIIATNSLPPTADKTEGFYRRWKIIDFPNKFNIEKEVLKEVPKEEYNNLALKCLNLAKKLWRERVFSQDVSIEERKRIYEDKSNPLNAFIKTYYEKDFNSETLFSEFFEELNIYLEERGFRTLSAVVVSKQLKIEGFEGKLMTKNNVNAKFILGLKPKIRVLEPKNKGSLEPKNREVLNNHSAKLSELTELTISHSPAYTREVDVKIVNSVNSVNSNIFDEKRAEPFKTRQTLSTDLVTTKSPDIVKPEIVIPKNYEETKLAKLQEVIDNAQELGLDREDIKLYQDEIDKVKQSNILPLEKKIVTSPFVEIIKPKVKQREENRNVGTFSSPISFTSQFYFCPVPLRLDTYSGCMHNCLYCFANNSNQKFIAQGDMLDKAHCINFSDIKPTSIKIIKKYLQMAFEGLPNTFSNQEAIAIECLKKKVPIHFGGMADGFQPCEKHYRISYETLKLFKEHDYPIILSTKGKLILDEEYKELINSYKNLAIQVSIIDDRQEVLDILEPHASTFEERLEILKTFRDKFTAVRIQPFIIFLSEERIIPMLDKFKEVGVNHIMVEGLKFFSGNKEANRRITQAFKKITGKSFDLMAYYKALGGTSSGNDVELPTWRKYAYIKIFKDEIKKRGMTFGCADNDLRFLGDSCCCCGTENLEGFGNMLKHNTGWALFKAIKENKTSFNKELIQEEFLPEGKFRMVMSNLKAKKRFGNDLNNPTSNREIKELFDEQWEKGLKNSPCMYCNIKHLGKGNYKFLTNEELENLLKFKGKQETL